MPHIADNIRLIAFALYCKEISADDHDLVTVKDDNIDVLWKGYNNTMEGLKENHFGDCTKDAISCKRCRADELIEDAKYIIGHWEKNDEIIKARQKARQIEIDVRMEEVNAMNTAIRDGSYDPTTISETSHGQTLVRTVDKKSGLTWEELYPKLKKKEK